MRVFVTGGTGLVGTRLVRQLLARGDLPVVVTRRYQSARQTLGPQVILIEGDPMQAGPWMEKIDDCDAVIHLAGENVFARRWNAEFKKLLVDSRVQQHAEHRPGPPAKARSGPRASRRCWSTPPPSASTVRAATRKSPRNLLRASDFLAKLCVEWENGRSQRGVGRRSLRAGARRRRARQGRRGAGEDADAVQAGRRRSGRQRQAVDGMDSPRGPDRVVPAGPGQRRRPGADQRRSLPTPSPTRTSRPHWARRCTGRRLCGRPGSPCGWVWARPPASSPPASASCRRRRWPWDTRSNIRRSTPPWPRSFPRQQRRSGWMGGEMLSEPRTQRSGVSGRRGPVRAASSAPLRAQARTIRATSSSGCIRLPW